VASNINGAHVMLFSADADADLAFYRDVIAFIAADAGAVGWCSRCRRDGGEEDRNVGDPRRGLGPRAQFSDAERGDLRPV